MGARYSVVGANQARCIASWVLMFRILYRFLTLLARLAVRSGRSKDLEIIVLRHQLKVLQRQNGRPRLNGQDRTVLGVIAAALPRPLRRSVNSFSVSQPRTQPGVTAVSTARSPVSATTSVPPRFGESSNSTASTLPHNATR